MAEMTKEDWQRKDMLNARQSALKAASILHEGQSVAMEGVLGEAQKALDWLTQDQVWTFIEKEQEIPVPTQEQKKALDKVLEETKWTKEQVYAKFNKYPDNSNVDKCIGAIKNG